MRSTLLGVSWARNTGVLGVGAGALAARGGRGACAVILPQVAAMAGQEDPVQREIHQDWANREYIEIITSSIKKISDFLNSFGQRASRGDWEEGGVGGGRRRRGEARRPGCSLPLPRSAGPSPLTLSLTRRSPWVYPAHCQAPLARVSTPTAQPPRPIHHLPDLRCASTPVSIHLARSAQPCHGHVYT